ncbi:2-trimethylaminoethylphosphonate dioxygenase [Rhodovibrionaceae bacterium A322]
MSAERAVSNSSTLLNFQVEPDWLHLTWSNGHTTRYPAVWLRDNVPSGRHQEGGQRLFDIISTPESLHLEKAELGDADDLSLTFQPEDITERFSLAWLQAHRLEESDHPAGDLIGRKARVLWGKDLQSRLPEADFQEISNNGHALQACLQDVWQLGFSVIHGVPTREEELFKMVELFGYVRETNYGPLFDVKTVENPTNLAFTPLKLGLHTDNPYRNPVPSLQLLHCLEAGAEGGETILCDGLQVAEKLRRDDPAAFELLTSWSVPFRYQDGETDLQSRSPLIELSSEGKVEAVRYNNRSAAPLDLPLDIMPDYYRAYRRFGGALHAAEAIITYQLRPGDLLLFDNRRVLHARGKVGVGRRHLQGCYADMDGLLSKLSRLTADKELSA